MCNHCSARRGFDPVAIELRDAEAIIAKHQEERRELLAEEGRTLKSVHELREESIKPDDWQYNGPSYGDGA